MTQTGEDNRRGMFRIRPYGAGFGQSDSAYKAGKGILFSPKIAFNFTHFILYHYKQDSKGSCMSGY